jgi:uncharacterized protein YidB (DUF937 family)
MIEDDKLAVLLDDPQSRETIFALAHSGHAAGPVQLRELAARALANADDAQRSSWLGAGPDNAQLSPGQIPAMLTDEVVRSVAAYLESDPTEVTRQLAQFLPDLLDALTPGGDLLPATELAQLMRADIVLDEDSAGAFGR